MDVDKKLGMSLDDLIKKTRKDVPKTAKPSANAVIQKKSGKTNVRRSEGKAKLGYVHSPFHISHPFLIESKRQ